MTHQLTITPNRISVGTIREIGVERSVRAFGRPVWRGRMHTWACAAAVPAGTLLTLGTDRPVERLAAAIYATTLVLLFGTSAAYHRLTKCERSRAIMQRLDHSMIFLLIVGTYTPLCLVALPADVGRPFLVFAASVASVGIVLKLVAFQRARWISWALYPLLGWASVTVAPALSAHLDPTQLALIVGGGVVYSVGLPVLLAKRPDPWPAHFGYHEVWHVLTIVGAVLHFAAIRDVLA